MDMELIERLIGLVERSRVTELAFEEGGTRVRIARRLDAPPAVRDSVGAGDDAAPTPAVARAGPPAAAAGHVVAAGTVGTFFRSPAPGQAPFVTEGDAVREGQTLAILEAMKMLNPVEADRAGRILRIFVQDGAPVEAGTPLFAMTD